MRAVENSSVYKGFRNCAPFLPQMRPERWVATDILSNEDAKTVYHILKKAEKLPLADLKEQAGLSNKKWDKAIKELTKNKLAKVEKTATSLDVSVV